MPADEDLKLLRDNLLRCCTDYDADQAVRTMASALITLIIGTTPDRAAAHRCLDRLREPVMRGLVDEFARPASTIKQ
jgi:hypothetical protein